MSSNLEAKVDQSVAILREAVERFSPVAVFGMLSGGHDSLCATHLLSTQRFFTAAAHINTTIGVEETRQFVRDEARDRQWRLREYYPPVSYRDIVLQHGFPGPGGHRFMYIRLKERCVEQLMREAKVGHKRNTRVGLVTGVRLSESSRRMGHVQPIKKEKARIWIAPILHWSEGDKREYMATRGLRRNPVVDTLCMSGECLCGAFAKKEELFDLGLSFPSVAAQITQLQQEAEAAGVHCRWGERPPKAPLKATAGGMMCSSCNSKNGAGDLA